MLFANSGHGARQAADTPQAFDHQAVWIDLLNPTEDERSAAERATGLRVPPRDDIAEIESSSRLYREGEVLFLSTPAAYRDAAGNSQAAPLGFVLSQQRLVTIRFAAMPVFDSFAQQFGTAPATSSTDAFIGVLEAIVDRLADVLEHVAADLDGVSRQTFQGEDGVGKRSSRRADRALRAALVQVGQSGDRLGHLRDALLGAGRVVAYATEMAHWASPEQRAQLASLKADIASLNDYDQQLGVKISFLLDAVLGFINIEQNNGVKVLTVVSVVGIPPTLIASMYGMNFKNMPEYDWAWGYQYGLTLIALSIILPLIAFKVKGWL